MRQASPSSYAERTHPRFYSARSRAAPRTIDVCPPAVVRWRRGVTLSGELITLPETVRVTSGKSSTARYALVCASKQPLYAGDYGRLDFGALRNLVSGNTLGASQVTAVVERAADYNGGRLYVVALRAHLVDPYFIRLTDPVMEQQHEASYRARAA